MTSAPQLRSARLPKSQQALFETRAASFWPREIEDFLIGKHRRAGLDIYMVLPTRLDDVALQTDSSISLKDIAFKRAKETASQMGLQVLGSVHTHPYRRWNGYGVCLSRADIAGFDYFTGPECVQPPVIATCAAYRSGTHPDSYKFYWAFWLKTQALRLRWRAVPDFLC